LTASLVSCSKESGYTLASYAQGTSGRSTITLHHGSQTIKAECKSSCDEYGTMVGQALSCFVEPQPSDPTHPYETKRPIFNATGGAFVCYAGRGKVFMVRHYSCITAQLDEFSQYKVRAEDEYPEDRLFVPTADLDRLYCKPGEQFHDRGGSIVNEDGSVLPIQHSVEWLDIIEAK
jgi:hypothetical protein